MFGTVVGGHLSTTTCATRSTTRSTPPSSGTCATKDDPIVFHDLRHTFGTLCAAKGIDLRRIQAWMGHADIQTTMRYLHYVPQHDDAARS